MPSPPRTGWCGGEEKEGKYSKVEVGVMSLLSPALLPSGVRFTCTNTCPSLSPLSTPYEHSHFAFLLSFYFLSSLPSSLSLHSTLFLAPPPPLVLPLFFTPSL